MPKAKRKATINVRKIEGDSTDFTFRIAYDSKTVSAEKQQEIWRGIGIALAAVMTPAECAELLDKLRTAKDGPAHVSA